MPNQPNITVIIPVYNYWSYAVDCVDSLLAVSPSVNVVIVDDASPEMPPAQWLRERIANSDGQHRYIRHDRNKQLTAAWNLGFVHAFDLKTEYIVAGNSDLLFSPGWWESLLYASAAGYHLVGPMTNTPGTSALQNIDRYVPDYALSNSREGIAATAAKLVPLKHNVELSKINGFFMWAKAADWKSGSFDSKHVFRPSNAIMPSGKTNRTPLMTGNEDELQARWKKMGRRFGVACGSFIFHYRSVSRGTRFAKGRWMRK
jgi:glycosyltransferase involved in cell wall biosynthesis